MKLLKGKTIKLSLKECQPRKIAVAYIGNDWNEFVDAKFIREIIVSPTIGSNPTAIKELVNQISWNNIYFLDNLHAKFYIGDSFAILGSSNLSKNGLDINGLEEAGVLITDKPIISDLDSYFHELKEKAIQSYSTIDSKKRRLAELIIERNKAMRQSIIKHSIIEGTKLSDYEPLSNDDFYISWYQTDDDYDYNDNAKQIEDLIDEDMHFTEQDEIVTGKWILAWKVTKSMLPSKRSNPTWIYIDEIFNNAILRDEEYTKLAISRNDKTARPPVPFDLNDKLAVEAFKSIIVKDKYRQAFIDNDPTYIKNMLPLFKDLISDMKQYYNQKKS